MARWGSVLWAVLCFLPTLGFGFVSWDDPLHVTKNPLVITAGEQPSLDHLLTPRLGYPSPITVLSYRLEAALFGVDSATPFHATNVLLFACLVAQVFGLARTLGLGNAAASVSALLFALHPVSAEPVSWVSGRKDLLAGVFGLLALQWVLRPPGHAPGRVAPVIAFSVALLCKPVAAFLALVIPVWALLGFGSAHDESELRLTPRAVARAALSAWPYLLLSLLMLPVAWHGQVATSSLRTDSSLGQLVREAWYALGFHLQLLLGVQAPSAKYLPTPWPPPFTWAIDLLPLAFGGALVIGTLRMAPPARRAAWAGASFALLSYLPTSNLIPLTRVLADVYVFMPLAGLSWWLGAVLDPWLRRIGAPVLRTAAVVSVGAALTLPSLASSSRFRDSVSLWASAYEAFPHDLRLCRNLANARFELVSPESALAQYRECAERFGHTAFDKNIGITLSVIGDQAGAREALLRAQQHHPQDETVRRYLERLQAQAPSGRTTDAWVQRGAELAEPRP